MSKLNASQLTLSIILPIYNEKENIRPLLNELRESLINSYPSYEVIAVDDGSRDGTTNLLKSLAQEYSELRVVVFRKNSGQAAAFDAGFRYATGKIIVSMDADLQNDPKDIPRLIDKLNEGYDVVSGWRKKRKDGFLLRTFPSRIANSIIRKVTGTVVHDLGCSLKVYRAEVTQDLRLYGEMHRFICPTLEMLGAKIAELEVNHRSRLAGQSKYGLGRTAKVLLDLLHVWFLRNFQTKPIYAYGGVGFVSLTLGSILGLYSLFFQVLL